ncbi:putative rRNA biogenesis protein rrp5 [Anaerovibrio sp. JC8]|nr:putative rRNA biogenesis protein rrp5 [Anaerovibrio sp. JC8]
MSIVRELKRCGEVLIALAEALSVPEVELRQEEKNKVSEEKQISMEEVRAVLAQKAASGLSDEVKALLDKHGAKKLSDINPENYNQLIKEAEGIGNAS